MKKIRAVIEMPQGTHYKYEIKKNKLILDRALNISVPENYGYIENTLAEDGDPLDIFVLSDFEIVPKTYCEVRVIGVFKCIDNGVVDDKIIAYLVGYSDREIPTRVKDIQSYLKNYKKGFEVLDYKMDNKAFEIIEKAQKRFKRRK